MKRAFISLGLLGTLILLGLWGCTTSHETAADFSALHRLQTDEVWHFYGGSPIELLLLYPDGHGQKVILGANVLAGELPQFTVPRAVWQGSTPRGTSPQRHALFGDQLSPAFLYEDFEVGYRDALQQRRRLELI